MIRHAVCTISAAAALALTVAAPAVACDQPSGTTSPQSQQEHAKFTDKGFFRHHHHHLRRCDRQQSGFGDQQSSGQKSSGQQSSDQTSFDGQQQGNCHHGDSNS